MSRHEPGGGLVAAPVAGGPCGQLAAAAGSRQPSPPAHQPPATGTGPPSCAPWSGRSREQLRGDPDYMLHRVVAGPDRTAHAGEPGLSCRSSSARTLCIWNGVAETLSTRPSFRPTNTSPVWPRIGRINAPASSADRQRSRNASRTTSAAGATPLLIPTKPIATMTAVRLATSFQGLRRGCGGGAGMTAGGPDRCNSSSAASKALLEMPAAVAAARRSATAVLPKRAASSWLARSSRRVATGSGRTSVSGFWRRCCTGYLRNARSVAA